MQALRNAQASTKPPTLISCHHAQEKFQFDGQKWMCIECQACEVAPTGAVTLPVTGLHDKTALRDNVNGLPLARRRPWNPQSWFTQR